MVFIPPPHLLKKGTEKPATQHDLTVSMLVVFFITFGIALFFIAVGPRTHNPPPPLIGYVVSGIALLFGFIAFFSWMKEQSEPDGAVNSHSDSES